MKKMDDYYLFMLCGVFAVCMFVFLHMNCCYTLLDELLLVVFSCSIMVVPYVVRRYRLFG